MKLRERFDLFTESRDYSEVLRFVHNGLHYAAWHDDCEPTHHVFCMEASSTVPSLWCFADAEAVDFVEWSPGWVESLKRDVRKAEHGCWDMSCSVCDGVS